MPDRKNEDRELQYVAVALWEQHGTQDNVHPVMQRLYPGKGRFDKFRVNRLCRQAIKSGIANPPSTATVKDGPETADLKRAFEEAKRRQEEIASVEPVIGRYCNDRSLGMPPLVKVVAGNVVPARGETTSEFAREAARILLGYLKTWSEENPGKLPYLGVTWGRQMHYAADSVTGILEKSKWGRPSRGTWVLPLVGLPIGGHRSEILSSSEIARELADYLGPATAAREERAPYDLQLVPAYLPEHEFSDTELPALYKLLKMMEGWLKVFGSRHMEDPAAERPAVSAPAVWNCDFIWSSVSDYAQPFGFHTSSVQRLIPFGERVNRQGRPVPRPVADCGGIPLWDDEHLHRVRELEAGFQQRWTGIRRHQWESCVEQGLEARQRNRPPCGVVLIAPTAEKAQSVLHAVRDKLVNILILGEPCMQKISEILRGAPAEQAASGKPRRNK